ncbi:non-specific serine,threonine protein kinase [Sarracenia purpurea var. burkii]
MNIAIETADTLAYLHASDIIHRDVKTNNILLDSNLCVKVVDFDLSRLYATDVTHVSNLSDLGFQDSISPPPSSSAVFKARSTSPQPRSNQIAPCRRCPAASSDASPAIEPRNQI